MMRFIRRRVRSVYFVQALIFLFLGVGGLMALGHSSGEVPFQKCVLLFTLVFVGVVDALAWWSTRKPSPYRNDFAIVASVLSICNGAFMLWLDRAHLSPTSPGLLTVILSAAGLAIFSQGGLPEDGRKGGVTAAAKPAAKPETVDAKPEKARKMEGDRGPVAEVSTGVFASDWIAEQVAERAEWDPVRVLRESAMQKSRS